MISKDFLQKIKLIGLGIFVAFFANLVVAWNGPTNTFPSNNLPAPINKGNYGQSKGKTSPISGTLFDIGGKVAASSTGINGDASLGGELILDNLKATSSEVYLCVDKDGVVIKC